MKRMGQAIGGLIATLAFFSTLVLIYHEPDAYAFGSISQVNMNESAPLPQSLREPNHPIPSGIAGFGGSMTAGAALAGNRPGPGAAPIGVSGENFPHALYTTLIEPASFGVDGGAPHALLTGARSSAEPFEPFRRPAANSAASRFASAAFGGGGSMGGGASGPQQESGEVLNKLIPTAVNANANANPASPLFPLWRSAAAPATGGSIDVTVATVVVPAPASLPLILGALACLGFATRRRARPAAN